MPEKLFLQDYKTGKEYTYANLIKDLNSLTELNIYSREEDLYSVFLHLTASILCKQNLILLDSDFSDSELSALEIDTEKLTSVRNIEPLGIRDQANLIERLMQPSDWQLTLFTSGTTGLPKKVVHTLTSLTRAVRISDRHTSDVWGFAYNPTHIAGLQVFFQALLNGNSLINLYGASRNLIFDLIKCYGITNISATPTFYRMLLPSSETYPTVRKLTSGGEKFDPYLAEQLLQIFPEAKLRNVYASTEAGTILEAKEDIFTITDETLCKVEDGELYIHRILLGESDDVTLDGDWYATGDLVEVISTNPTRFRFLHRKNEMINVGGYKVNPYEVETALEKHPQVKQAYVYGKANSLTGNILIADVVAESNIQEKELRTFLASSLQPFKLPRVINFVDSIELTRSGKLKRT